MDTSIDRINLPYRGALIITSARSDLQGGVHLVREHPTEAIRYAKVHPSSSTERPSAGLLLSTKELWTPVLSTPMRCVRGRRSRSTSHYQSRRSNPGNRVTVLLTSEDPSNEATTR